MNVGHPGLTAAEMRSEIGAFSLVAAPLGISFDMVKIVKILVIQEIDTCSWHPAKLAVLC